MVRLRCEEYIPQMRQAELGVDGAVASDSVRAGGVSGAMMMSSFWWAVEARCGVLVSCVILAWRQAASR